MSLLRYYLLFFLCVSLDARERISSFASTIIVNKDATLTVQETIEVISENKEIIHGIVREFPTRYSDHGGTNYIVGFTVQSVRHNGEAASFFIKSVANGKKIYIGDKDTILSRGKHTYNITYTTDRQLGFFQDHDELYWNVTGNGWRLPIDTVKASVQLPEGISADAIKVQGYTGYYGDQEKNYHAAIENNRVVFATTALLKKNQGLTVVVTFSKGFVDEPSLFQKWYWFMRDNALMIFFGIGLLILLIIIFWGYIIARRKNRPGTIIPLFYPPQGLSPSQLGFMKARGFKDALIGADIVDLAVRGFVTIEYNAGQFFGGSHTLMLTEHGKVSLLQKNIDTYDYLLLATLFPQKESLLIAQENNTVIKAAIMQTQKYCVAYENRYITALTLFLYTIYTLSFFIAFVPLLFVEKNNIAQIGIAIVLLLGEIFFIKDIRRVYTPEGRKLQDYIDGFELYLTTTELERMNIIGSPPTKTPQLYEKYLPYAIALGVEKQWSAQFAAVFASLAAEGHPYTPLWYYGSNFHIDRFGSELGSTFSSGIASASTPPGKSSGSSGSGRSGGGGGGGGGGGW